MKKIKGKKEDSGDLTFSPRLEHVGKRRKLNSTGRRKKRRKKEEKIWK